MLFVIRETEREQRERFVNKMLFSIVSTESLLNDQRVYLFLYTTSSASRAI